MEHIKTYGLCTRNEKSMFEIHWEVESTWYKRMFKIPTEFKFMCDYEVGKRIYRDTRYLNQIDVQWYDEEGNKLMCGNTLHELIFVLQMLSYYKTFK